MPLFTCLKNISSPPLYTYFPHVNFKMNLSEMVINIFIILGLLSIYLSFPLYPSYWSPLEFYLFMYPSTYSFYPLYFITDYFIFIWRLFGCVCHNIIPSYFIKIFTVYIRFLVHFEFSRYTIISPKIILVLSPFQIFIFTYFPMHILITASK